jgi:RAB protein geranylgeranyltransferase component A
LTVHTSVDKLKTIVFVLQSYDATTHFETTVQDVLSMYNKITGKVTQVMTIGVKRFTKFHYC